MKYVFPLYMIGKVEKNNKTQAVKAAAKWHSCILSVGE